MFRKRMNILLALILVLGAAEKQKSKELLAFEAKFKAGEVALPSLEPRSLYSISSTYSDTTVDLQQPV